MHVALKIAFRDTYRWQNKLTEQQGHRQVDFPVLGSARDFEKESL